MQVACINAMDNPDHDILQVQQIIQRFDIKKCRIIDDWLSAHIRTLEVDKKLFKINIHQLRLSARTYNLLMENEINSVGKLLARSADWDSIRMLKGAGEKVQQEIKQKIAQIHAGNFLS